MVQGGDKEGWQAHRHHQGEGSRQEHCGQVGLLSGHPPRYFAEEENHQEGQVVPCCAVLARRSSRAKGLLFAFVCCKVAVALCVLC